VSLSQGQLPQAVVDDLVVQVNGGMAASIAFLLSDDAVNINGAILPSDSGWSIQ
jgi:hypothetical protein